MDDAVRLKFADVAGIARLPFLTIRSTAPGSIIAKHVGDADPSKVFFLAEICFDAPDEFVTQLVGCDAVHTAHAGSIEDVRRYRLGGPDHNKTCFTIMDGKGVLHTAICVRKAYKKIEQPGQLLGNVRAILETPTEINKAKPLSEIFYSVTSMNRVNRNLPKIDGIGSRQITEAYAHLKDVSPDAVKSTLSPLRFEDYLTEIGVDLDSIRNDGNRIAILATEYLQAGINPVQKIHMPLGAWPVAIRTGSGDISTRDGREMHHVAMVNYLYDSDPTVLESNARKFKEGDYSGINPVHAPA